MKSTRFAGVALILSLVLTGACTAEVEDKGELPNVEVEGGEAPTVDVDPATVEVTTSTDTNVVVTPDVDVNVTPDTTRG